MHGASWRVAIGKTSPAVTRVEEMMPGLKDLKKESGHA